MEYVLIVVRTSEQQRPATEINLTDESLASSQVRSIWQIPLSNLRPGLTLVGTLVGLILLQPLMAVLGNMAFAVLVFAWYYRGLETDQQQRLEQRVVGGLRNALRNLRGARRRERRS